MTDVVSIRGLSKSFAGQQALLRVDLDLRAGEIHGLCGANGSGKSTLIKILSGFHEPDPGGSVTVDGVELPALSADARSRMHFIHQDLGLIDTLSAAENLELGPLSDRAGLRPLSQGASRARARDQLAALGIAIDVRAPVGTLAPVERTMIAIARATQTGNAGTALLVLDEPTVSLSAREVRQLYAVARTVRDQGAAVLYVSHRLDEVLELCDVVTVLRDGQVVLTEPVHAMSHGRLVTAIVGDADESVPARSPGPRHDRAGAHDDPVLSVRDVRLGAVTEFDLDIARGEIVGITGLVGSGMELVCDIVFGVRPPERGTVAVNGRQIDNPSPAAAMRHGFALVPAERLRRGCIPAFSIRENMSLAALGPLHGRSGRIRKAVERAEVASWARRVGVQSGSIERPLARLSGGNQQKVVLARAMRTNPSVLVLHEPTQGVDVGARAGIHRLLREAAEDGLSVLAVSADTADLAAFADRVLIMHDGRITEELAGARLTPQALAAAVLSRLEPEPEGKFL